MKVEESVKEEIVISDDSDIEMTIVIDGKKVVSSVILNKNDLRNILKNIGYGEIGWEVYKLVEKIDFV